MDDDKYYLSKCSSCEKKLAVLQHHIDILINHLREHHYGIEKEETKESIKAVRKLSNLAEELVMKEKGTSDSNSISDKQNKKSHRSKKVSRMIINNWDRPNTGYIDKKNKDQHCCGDFRRPNIDNDRVDVIGKSINTKPQCKESCCNAFLNDKRQSKVNDLKSSSYYRAQNFGKGESTSKLDLTRGTRATSSYSLLIKESKNDKLSSRTKPTHFADIEEVNKVLREQKFHRNDVEEIYLRKMRSAKQQICKKNMYKATIDGYRPGSKVFCPCCVTLCIPTIRNKTNKAYSNAGGGTGLCFLLCKMCSPFVYQDQTKDYLYCPKCLYFLGIYDNNGFTFPNPQPLAKGKN